MLCSDRQLLDISSPTLQLPRAFPPRFYPQLLPPPRKTNSPHTHPSFSHSNLSLSRLGQLLLPEPAEEARTHNDLGDQPDPEPGFFETMQTECQIREDGAGPGGIRRAGAGDDGGNGAQDLRAHQSEHDVEPSQRLEEDHAEADALNGVEGAEPEPEGPARQSAGEGGAGPRYPHSHARRRPQHLAPARGAETDGEHGEDPRMAQRCPREDGEQHGPDTDEEAEDEEDDGPRRCVDGAPEVSPVAPVWC